MLWTIVVVMIVVWLLRLVLSYAKRVRSRHAGDCRYHGDSRLHSGATREGSRILYPAQSSCPIKAKETGV